MGVPGILAEKTRVFSIIAVVGLAGGLFAFLFHDTPTVDIQLLGPSAGFEGETLLLRAEVGIPTDQRLPLAAVSFVVQNASTSPSGILDVATCWVNTACGADVLHSGPRFYEGLQIEPDDAPVSTSTGPLSVWVKGYGHSSSTGYGTEVEPQRRLVATDVIDETGRQAYGAGYEGQTLRFSVLVPASELGPGEYHLAFLVDTGSRDMGSISGPTFPLRIFAAELDYATAP
jgi:hypothetical protein